MLSIQDTINDLYQQEASKVLATLLRVLGPSNLALAEDLVQEAFSKALQHWEADGLPEAPAAWLKLTAKRAAIDHLRQHNKRQHILNHAVLPTLQSEWTLSHAMESAFSEQLVQDDQLRLLFWLSSTELSAAQRLPLALKILCGMNVDAIARALLSKPETIKKRLSRAKRQLVEVQFEIPCDDELPAALDRVHQCLYLLFNEGISAHNPNPASRNDICASALGFMRLIISEPRFRNAESLSLTALMHLHYARLPSRFDIRGLPLTLMEQDRSTWLAPHLKLGMSLLQRALDSANSTPSVYLLEALIAFEHCRATEFAQTQWQTIVQHYKVLLNINPSALNLLSAAVAMTEMGDVRDALALLDENEFIEYDAIKGHYFATLAYINWKRGQRETALAYADKARQAGLPQLDFNTLVRQIKV